jgi:hypothetical protein
MPPKVDSDAKSLKGSKIRGDNRGKVPGLSSSRSSGGGASMVISKGEIDKQKQSVETLASFVPLYVRQHAVIAATSSLAYKQSPSEKKLDVTCIAVVDLSGFTKHCEECSKEGSIGVEKLTISLNSAMSRMVNNVEPYGGDILKVC